MATIKEVARRARVSVGTVSNVMRGTVSVSAALRERVERAARDLSYHPNHVARSLKSRKTQTLGMVISDITNPFFPLVVRGAEDAALARGYLLNIFNTDDHVEREESVCAMLRTRRVDGVLAVVAPNTGRPIHLQEMIDAGIPLVCLDRIPPGLAVDSVVVDNAKGAAMCVRHLIAMGHCAIGVISGSANVQTARERVNGYRRALAEAGISFNPSLLREGDFRLDSGYRLAKDLCLSNPRPTVLFVANGTMGLGAIKAIQEMGLRCPEDVGIAVFDDVPGADILRPHLTVVSQPAYEIGYRGTELLIQRIAGEVKSKKPVTIVLEPELKIRESTIGARLRP
jgi:LacI family transcriptional regulator